MIFRGKTVCAGDNLRRGQERGEALGGAYGRALQQTHIALRGAPSGTSHGGATQMILPRKILL